MSGGSSFPIPPAARGRDLDDIAWFQIEWAVLDINGYAVDGHSATRASASPENALSIGARSFRIEAN